MQSLDMTGAIRIIVAGASSGVGAALAQMLAPTQVRMALVARRRERLDEIEQRVEALGSRVEAIAADLSDPTTARQAMERAMAALGGVDVLVNCMGTNIPDRSLDVLSVDNWERILATNLSGPFYCIHAVLPAMRRQGRGRIISISSVAGLRPSALSGAAYSASKSGLNALSSCINLEEGRHGIRSCVICPGDIDTELLDQRPNPPAKEQRARMLRPEDVAQAVLAVMEMPDRSRVDLVEIHPAGG